MHDFDWIKTYHWCVCNHQSICQHEDWRYRQLYGLQFLFWFLGLLEWDSKLVLRKKSIFSQSFFHSWIMGRIIRHGYHPPLSVLVPWSMEEYQHLFRTPSKIKSSFNQSQSSNGAIHIISKVFSTPISSLLVEFFWKTDQRTAYFVYVVCLYGRCPV